MKPTISVVVPVYNVEAYLERCINSILSQTFGDYEVVLVDDGSSDISGEICDRYAKSNENFKVIHKANKGPSDTRNVGIENSNGEYLYFLDSDDYIIPECLETLYNNLIKNEADISCGSFGFFDDRHPVSADSTIENRTLVLDGEDACIRLLYGKGFYTSSCNMLIKADIAKENPFPVGKYHEDEMTTFRYLLAAAKVVKTNADTYYYYQREGSIMHSLGQPVIDEVLAGDYYVDECRRRNLDKRVMKAALCKKYFLYVSTVENYPMLKDNDPEFYSEVLNYIRRNTVKIMLDLNTPVSIRKKAFKHLV